MTCSANSTTGAPTFTPPTPMTTHRITVNLTPANLAALDRLSGTNARSRAVQGGLLISQAMAKLQPKKTK